jgi:hypothetical protein
LTERHAQNEEDAPQSAQIGGLFFCKGIRRFKMITGVIILKIVLLAIATYYAWFYKGPKFKIKIGKEKNE